MPQAQYQMLQKMRQYQKSEQFQQRYATRAGVEGCLSQGVRAFGLRRSRYLGLAKTHLQHVITAIAINLSRLWNWSQGMPKAQTLNSPTVSSKGSLQVGSSRGEVEWHPPNRMTLQNLLKNPAYAEAYAYGRRQIDPCKKQPGRPSTGRVVNATEDWHALVMDRFPAYISWEQYQQNLARLQANQTRADSIGAARHGSALLSGLLICGCCGWRMTVHYSS